MNHLNQKLDEINHQIAAQPNTVVDGAINLQRYLQSKYKILWVLKEPYSLDGESFSYQDMFGSEDLYEDFFKNVAVPTWHPILYISYSILNGFTRWVDLNFIREQPDMCQVIQDIAIINANKSFSVTGTYTLNQHLAEGFEHYKEINVKQIELLQPDMVIFGGTFGLFEKHLNINETHQVHFPSPINTRFYKKGAQLFVDTNHPGARIKREFYVDPIVGFAENYFKK